jgi:hypothetical protein
VNVLDRKARGPRNIFWRELKFGHTENAISTTITDAGWYMGFKGSRQWKDYEFPASFWTYIFQCSYKELAVEFLYHHLIDKDKYERFFSFEEFDRSGPNRLNKEKLTCLRRALRVERDLMVDSTNGVMSDLGMALF